MYRLRPYGDLDIGAAAKQARVEVRLPRLPGQRSWIRKNKHFWQIIDMELPLTSVFGDGQTLKRSVGARRSLEGSAIAAALGERELVFR